MPHARRKSATTLDPRGALVFDTRALGRQAGAAREETRTIPAPDNLQVELAGVPAGAEVELDVRLEAVHEGVLVTGTATAPVTGECARCLEPLTSSVEASFQELYHYEPSPEEEDEDVLLLDGDLLDLEPVLRDAVVLALPLSPLCSDDCAGLCPECGVRLAEAGPGHQHDDAVLPEWEMLRQLNGFETEDQTGRLNGAEDRQEG
ncbi:MAG TPA: DUF177 domain-containing protein [Streptosporangiaceae bacterium]|nr:DUF177 domain-containing protein [Streptosporangiaceae bacterium]